MNIVEAEKLGLLAWVVIVFAVLLMAGAVIWHGVTVETLNRLWRDLADRPGGPMKFRFFLQPVMVSIPAILDGINDSHAGRSPYFWTVLSKPQQRLARLREALNATARIILLGLAMDVIYQAIVLKTFYPAEALIVALLFAFVPYLVIRGPAARIARRWHGRASASKPS